MKLPVRITVNGRMFEREVEPRLLLVHFLREVAALTGTKIGCDTSQCGSCTVLVDGEAVKSCTCLTAQADGASVTDHRRAGAARHAAPDPGGVLEQARPAMRVLHAGDGLDVGRTPCSTIPIPRPRDPPRPRRQPVPLHRLPEHRARRAVEAAAAMGGRMSGRIFGSAIRRREDPRLLTGPGTFTDDLSLPGMVARGDAAQPARACQDPAHRHRARRPRRRACSPSTPPKTPTGRSSRCPCALAAAQLRPQGRRVPAVGEGHRALRRRHRRRRRRRHAPIRPRTRWISSR